LSGALCPGWMLSVGDWAGGLSGVGVFGVCGDGADVLLSIS